MITTCEHCGQRNDVPAAAQNSEVVCQKCGRPFPAITDINPLTTRTHSHMRLTLSLLSPIARAILRLVPRFARGKQTTPTGPNQTQRRDRQEKKQNDREKNYAGTTIRGGIIL